MRATPATPDSLASGASVSKSTTTNVSMSAAASDFQAAPAVRNGNRAYSTQKKKVYRSECLVPVIKQRIWRDWLRGVGLRSLGICYELRVGALEEILREQARLALAIARRPAVAIGIALVCVCGMQSYEAAVSDDGGIQILRVKRGRRGRRRGDESGYRPGEYRAFEQRLLSGAALTGGSHA